LRFSVPVCEFFSRQVAEIGQASGLARQILKVEAEVNRTASANKQLSLSNLLPLICRHSGRAGSRFTCLTRLAVNFA
jgi:hypothetical protein